MITVNWQTGEIFVPKNFTTMVSMNPEVRQLDLEQLQLEIKSLEDNEIGITYLDTHRHSVPVSVGGVSLARVVEIINHYSITIEDGEYRVDAVGANSNILDVLNYNRVQVTSANTAGLVDSDAGVSSGLSAADIARLDAIEKNTERMLKAYGMLPGASFKMPPATGGPVLEDGQPIADVTGDCKTGFTVTGRSS